MTPTPPRRVLDLYPAIDLRDGRVVRLLKGDYDAETVYGDDPVGAAEAFVDAGATWIHVVDLDAARSGDPLNRPVVAAVVRAVADRAQVQTGGGVRSLDDASALRDAGVARVVMGSAAVQNPDLVAAAAELLPVAVGLDHRNGDLAVHGWTEGSGVRLDDALQRFPAAAAFVITDISRDGMLTGPDIEGLAAAVSATHVPVIASGGVATLADLVELSDIDGLGGVITGKALYEGRFTVGEALAACRAGVGP
jgi:phosphoribosylformimino-5-aminoimidazole carboxamide ribotide isomerase